MGALVLGLAILDKHMAKKLNFYDGKCLTKFDNSSLCKNVSAVYFLRRSA